MRDINSLKLRHFEYTISDILYNWFYTYNPVLVIDFRRKSALTNQATIFLARYLCITKNLCSLDSWKWCPHFMAHFSNTAEKELWPQWEQLCLQTGDMTGSCSQNSCVLSWLCLEFPCLVMSLVSWLCLDCVSVRLSMLIMVALWNRADHYIFALWFLPSFFSFPNLSCLRLDICHTSTHGVALVRI